MRGRAWLSGLGFLSILAAIAILAVLGARVLSDTEEVRTSPVDAARELDAAATTDPSSDGVVLPGTGAAGAARCEADRRALEQAVQAHELAVGAPPGDQQALVDAGFLAEPLDTHTLTLVDGVGVVAGVGVCA